MWPDDAYRAWLPPGISVLVVPESEIDDRYLAIRSAQSCLGDSEQDGPPAWQNLRETWLSSPPGW